FRPSGVFPVADRPSKLCDPFEFPTVGVGQPARLACLGNWSKRSVPSALGLMSVPLSFQSRVVVTQPAIAASAGSAPPAWFGPPFDPSLALGVFQPFSDPPEPLSDMRRTEARSAGIDRPAGVARSFQVSLYKVEPAKSVFARNLLAKDDWRAAVFNKPVEVRP